MIKSTEEQLIQFDRKIEGAMEDLRLAVLADEEATFLSVGANVGMALQKLADARQILAAQMCQQMPGKTNIAQDPWEDDQCKEEIQTSAAYIQEVLNKENRYARKRQ